MSHNNLIADADAFFEVNAISRAIKNKTPTKIALIQNDHNSERFTFSLPRFIEGHDMMESDRTEVHYINVDSTTKEQNKGLYEVEDIHIDPEDENKVVCSWLISREATKYVGGLAFAIAFTCFAEDGVTVEYAWHSAICNEITITAGINNTEVISEQYADIIAQWEAKLFGINDDGVENIKEASAKAMKEINGAIQNSIVQTTGDSETKVMSQKATTEAVLNLANKVAPSPASVTLYADRWEQDEEDIRYHQEVVVANATITPRSKVDLQLSAEQITIFYEKDLAFVAENDNGVVTVYCIGQVPENDYIIQATVSEVIVNG